MKDVQDAVQRYTKYTSIAYTGTIDTQHFIAFGTSTLLSAITNGILLCNRSLTAVQL